MAESAEASTTTSDGKKATLAGLVLAAVSPVALPFTEWAQSNPWTALPLVAVWEVVLLAVAFALDVWAEVRPTLVGRAAEAVKFWIDCLISRHRQRYLQDVIFQHRNFDVKGLSTQATFTLELEHVFVDLSVAPIAPHQASADMIRKLPPELREGRHQVWDFLEGASGGRPRLMLLGAPGSGKTTLVKHIALTFAHGQSPKPNLTARRNLPILLFLREHAEAITKDPDAKLSELVARYQRDKRQRDIPAAWFDTHLRRERCLVMLDGLDEVADPEIRRKVASWADQQMSIHGGNRFIITSRPHGYRDNPLSGVNLLDVRPFTGDQVRDFVHRWYVANEIKFQQRDDLGVRQDAKTGARDLLERLHGAPALSDLAVNPLLLTMIATVHRERSSLPGSRADLYAQICDVSLGKRQQSKGIQIDLTAAQKQRVLEPLAWKMMVARKREISKSDACAAIQGTLRRVNQRLAPGDFLVSVENDSSLLLEKEAGGVYAFAHQTFQEFLAACHAQENAAPARRGERVSAHEPIEVLTRNIRDGWWAETIRLFAAKGDATPILRACISGPVLDPEALALAIQCMEEAERKDPELEQELDRIVEAGLNEADPAKRKPSAEALLKVRLARMRRLDEDRYIDPKLVSHAEYQLFFDERQAHGDDRRPLHWKADRFPDGQGRAPILGLSFADALAFCEWLTEREGRQRRFRLPTIEEIQSADAKRAAGEAPVAWAFVSGSDSRPAPWPDTIEGRQMAIATKRGTTARRNLARARRLMLETALVRNLARAPDLVRYLDLARALNLDFAADIARALDFALPLQLDLDLALDLDLDLALDLDLDRALDRVLDLGLEWDLVLALNRAWGGGLSDVAHGLNSARGPDLARDPWMLIAVLLAKLEEPDTPYSTGNHNVAALIRARNRGLVLVFLWKLFGELLEWKVEAFLGSVRFQWVWSLWGQIRARLVGDASRGEGQTLIATAEEVVWDLQMAARLAHARIKGTAPPFEALRIVRERVTSEPGDPT